MSLINVRMGTRAKGTKSGSAGGGASSTYYAPTAGSADWAERAALALELDPAAKILANLLKGTDLASLLVPVLADGTELPFLRAAEAAALLSKKDLLVDGIVSASVGAPGSIAASALADLTDVTLSAVQNGQALVFENGQWVNKAIGGGAEGAVTALGVSGGYLTWTKDGVTNNLRVPYADSASALYSNGVIGDFNATINKNGIYAWVAETANRGVLPSYGTFLQWSNVSDPIAGTSQHWITQLASATDYNGLWIRTRTNEAAWAPWERILTSVNYSGQLDSRYARKDVDESITGFWTFYRSPQIYAGAGGWAYERFTCGSNYWDIATTDTASGVMSANALEFRKLGGNGAGMFLRWDGSSFGKLCIVSETTESSIGYFDRGDLSKPKWTVGTQIGGNYCFGWWASGPNYSPGWRMALSEAGLLTIQTIHGPRIQIGAKNPGWIHYDSVDGKAHWFSTNVHVAGQLYAGQNYDQLVWHAGNDGPGSGLNADLLDGYHCTDFFKYNGWWRSGDSHNIDDATGMLFTYVSHGAPVGWGMTTTFEYQLGCGYKSQLHHSGINNRLFFRSRSDDLGGWTSWREVAGLDSNVASATKLQTGRSIWGQSFNGENNVSGDMYNVNHIFSSGYFYSNISGTNCSVLDFHSDGSLALNYGLYQIKGLPCKIYGNVIIGTDSSSYKLTVNGDIYATSGWLRTYGQNGLYFESYGGGIYMIDSTWIRTSNEKSFYTGAGIIRSDNGLQVGGNGSAFYANSAGTVCASGEIISTSANAFRAIQGNYGFFIRNDGSNTYFMFTNAGDQYGSWNHLRPFYISNISGDVTMEHNLEVRGNIMCKGVVAAAA